FSTFGPLALAANRIDCLPTPLQTKCLVINMTRRQDPSRRLLRPDTVDPDFDIVYGHTFMWTRDLDLNPEPPLPLTVKGRYADQWRPLLPRATPSRREGGPRARRAAPPFAPPLRHDNLLAPLLRDLYAAPAADRRDHPRDHPYDPLRARALCDALIANDD